jgi:hypothetical protein
MGILTINTTAEQDARIVDAFGKYLNTETDGVPRDATGGEVKVSLINFLKAVVLGQERKTAEEAITLADLNPT